MKDVQRVSWVWVCLCGWGNDTITERLMRLSGWRIESQTLRQMRAGWTDMQSKREMAGLSEKAATNLTGTDVITGVISTSLTDNSKNKQWTAKFLNSQKSCSNSGDKQKKLDGIYSRVPAFVILTHRSPGLNSRENFVLFFLCFLFRLRMESGMLFLRLVPRPPLWEEAVELADDVKELQRGKQVLYAKAIFCVLSMQKLIFFPSVRLCIIRFTEWCLWSEL